MAAAGGAEKTRDELSIGSRGALRASLAMARVKHVAENGQLLGIISARPSSRAKARTVLLALCGG